MATKKKEKLQLEFELRSSPTILFECLSTPTGLSGWFADRVDIQSHTLIFHWDDGNVSKAEILKNVQNKAFRFRFLESKEDEYVEFEILQDELTGDVALLITDFCEPKEVESTKMLWEATVDELRNIIGA